METEPTLEQMIVKNTVDMINGALADYQKDGDFAQLTTRLRWYVGMGDAPSELTRLRQENERLYRNGFDAGQIAQAQGLSFDEWKEGKRL
jgi:hypothetical protein